MFAQPTLLAAHEGKSGPFIHWLEQLGLKDFLRRYPLPKLVEWGWLVPQYRVQFPRRFFEAWHNYPCISWEPPSDLQDYATLWDYSWGIDPTDKPLWFLDPIFHPEDICGALLRKHPYIQESNTLPLPFEHARGISITPYVDYFYSWQGYALVDVIRHADCIEPIYSTPDIVERAQGLMQIAEHTKSIHPTWPQGILTAPRRWGGLSIFMTQLGHFTGLQNAISHDYKSDFDQKQYLYRMGAHCLAQHFNLNADELAATIKGHLLVLAQEWMGSNSKLTKRSTWTLRAWPHLQSDIK